MSARFMVRLTARRPFVASITPRSQAFPAFRTYAIKAEDNSPSDTSKATNPQSSSAQGQATNFSRSKDDATASESDSVQTPVSNPSESGMGQQEEGREALKMDPNEPAEKKRANVEKEGQKPLDPADK
ncbi:hypothetical protein LTS18_008957 [Coniosporium uncinatum]|uniref:Uncharacterized protein n=1 Tax=Coniosporium uncinatum TaxID=93489 RepID=A0ACC3D126_9PEZI|nr:hypothetical protein LTS18_008957 [Coniosporium uncinatum]